MNEARTIYCCRCGCYCGTIQKASLMKGLKYICVNCDNKSKSNPNGSSTDTPDFFKQLFGM